MALTRIKTWVREKLTYNDLNSEFNNIVDFINAFTLTNPWGSDVDGGNYFLNNVKLKKAFRIRNAEHFDSIQDAIDDITSDADGAAYRGGIVYLPPGVYTLSNNVTMANDVYIVGSGWKSIVRKSYAEDIDNEMFNFYQVSKGGLINFWIDGESSLNKVGATAEGVTAVRIDDCDDILIDRMFISGMGAAGDGIDAQNDGIYIGNSAVNNRIWVTRNRIAANARNGISATYADHLWLLDNKLQGNLHAGIDIEPEVTTGQAINYAIVRGNNCQSNTSYGIVISNGATSAATDYGCQKILCEGNVCLANATGILAQGNKAAVYAHNICADNTEQGMTFKGNIAGCSIVGNSIYSNGLEGLRCFGDQVTSNVSRNISITGNSVYENGDTGANIGSNDGDTYDLSIIGNTFYDNSVDTVGKSNLSIGAGIEGLSIVNNTLRRNSTAAANLVWGINFPDQCTDVVIQGNYTKNHGAGTANGLRFNAMQLGDVEIGHNIFKDGTTGVLS